MNFPKNYTVTPASLPGKYYVTMISCEGLREHLCERSDEHSQWMLPGKFSVNYLGMFIEMYTASTLCILLDNSVNIPWWLCEYTMMVSGITSIFHMGKPKKITVAARLCERSEYLGILKSKIWKHTEG